MLKRTIKKLVLFLIEHFLLEKRWIVFVKRDKEGQLEFVGEPQEVEVAYLGTSPIGFARKRTNSEEGYVDIEAQCIPLKDSEILFDTCSDAAYFFAHRTKDLVDVQRIIKDRLIKKSNKSNKKGGRKK